MWASRKVQWFCKKQCTGRVVVECRPELAFRRQKGKMAQWRSRQPAACRFVTASLAWKEDCLMKSFSMFSAGCLIFLSGCGAGADDTRKTGNAGTNEQGDVRANANGGPATIQTADDSADHPGGLMVGDPAPALMIAKWAKGDPIESLERGQIYVVEFWATWCGPCITNMPHLSELQEQYGEKVRFVGVSDEDEQTVTQFLKRNARDDQTWDDIIKYTIALDDNQMTTASYMHASGQQSIPMAFVVGSTGRVEWTGHPMGMDEPLRQIVAGEWDLHEAIVQFREQRAVQEALMEAQGELDLAMQSEDWDAAVAVVDSLVERFPDRSSGFKLTKLRLLQHAGLDEQFAAFADRLLQEQWEDPRFLDNFAWNIAVTMSGESRKLELALKAARQASTLTNHSDPSIMETLARVYFEQGLVDNAIAAQKKAIDIQPSNSGLKRTLAEFQSKAAQSRETAAAADQNSGDDQDTQAAEAAKSTDE